jgi:hypothetical protein
MALSAFDDRTHRPEPADLEITLGKAAGFWDQLVAHVADHYAPITELWQFAGTKYGWSLRLRRKERTVLYLTPQRGMFLVGLALGEKAVQAALRGGLPADVRAVIDGAPRYAEGRGVRPPVARNVTCGRWKPWPPRSVLGEGGMIERATLALVGPRSAALSGWWAGAHVGVMTVYAQTAPAGALCGRRLAARLMP